jgi:hypothetical protein
MKTVEAILAFIGASAVLLIAWMSFGAFWGKRFQRRMLKERKHLSLATFIEEFEGTSYCGEAIVATYDDIAGWCRFPVRRKDEFDMLGIGDEGEDLLSRRCEDFGIADMFESPYAKHFPLFTVEDYVSFLSDVMKDGLGRYKPSPTAIYADV